MMNRKVNICRPGFGASCSLCCGSHNVNAARGEIESMFSRRFEIAGAYSREFLVKRITAWRSRMTGSYYIDDTDALFNCTLPALFADCPRCPCIGFTDNNRLVGCLLGGEEGPSDLRRECFLSYRGKIFSCPAREELDDAEILYAARLTGDWYYYSILIHGPELLRRTMKDFPDPDDVPPPRREALCHELEELIVTRRELHAIHGYFS